MKMNIYLGVCRNYFYEDLDRYFALSAQAPSKKDFIDFCLRNGFEPLKVIKLKPYKELRLFSTFSPINILNPMS